MYNEPIADPDLVACLHCDLLQRLPDLAPGASARCPRCNKELWLRREDSINRTLALTIGAAILYVIANSVPMLGLTIVGRDASTTVIGGARHLWENGQVLVGVLVLLTAVIAPALQIGFMLVIMLAVHFKRTSAMDRDAAPSPSCDTNLEHDRSHDARCVGGSHQDRGLRDGDTRAWLCSCSGRWSFCWRPFRQTSIPGWYGERLNGRRAKPIATAAREPNAETAS